MSCEHCHKDAPENSVCEDCKMKAADTSKVCDENCECDCHIFVGGSGKPCPECSENNHSQDLLNAGGGRALPCRRPASSDSKRLDNISELPPLPDKTKELEDLK